MAVSETTVQEQIATEEKQSRMLEIMRLKQLVRDYDDALDYALDVWGVMAEVTGCWGKYDRLHERARMLKAIPVDHDGQ